MEWLRERASALVIAGLIIVSCGFFFLGYKETSGSPNLSSFFYTVAGALLAASVTTIFFNLPDTANYISRTVSRLISTGDVAKLLSPHALESLVRAATISRLQDRVRELPEELYEVVHSLRYAFLSGPYLTEYRYSNDLKPDEKDMRFVWSEATIRYKINIRHLSARPYPFKFSYNFEWRVKESDAVVVDDWVAKFRVRIGNEVYGKENLVVKSSHVDDYLDVNACFSAVIDINDNDDVTIETVARVTDVDPADVMLFRYPVFGFSGSLSYDDQREFDVAVFRTVPSDASSLPCGDPVVKSRGIEFSCPRDWAFPGGGFAFFFPVRKCGRSLKKRAEELPV